MKTETEEREELRDVARRIEDWRVSAGMSQEELARRYPDTGSVRGFVRCLEGSEDVDAAEAVTRLRTVLNLLELDAGAEEDARPVHDDFTAFTEARASFAAMCRERGNRRFMAVIGRSGAGKTTLARYLMTRYPGRVLMVEAKPAWKNAKGAGTDRALLRAILSQLGGGAAPGRAADMQERAEELLCRRRVCVVVEEAHELCLQGLMTLKALINTTPGEFLATAHPKLWDDLQRKSWSAVSQLTGNRLWARVDMRVLPEDAALWLDRCGLPPFAEEKKAGKRSARAEAAAHLARQAASTGGWSFVEAALRRVAREEPEALTLEMVIKQCEREARSRAA